MAPLVRDSLLDPDPAVPADARQLVFRGDDVEVSVVVRAAGPAVDIDVTVAPDRPYALTYRSDGALARSTTDDTGHGALTGVRSGLGSILVEAADGQSAPVARTAWVTF